MRGTIRSFLLFGAATFLVASLIHSGVLIAGYEHQKAGIADGRRRDRTRASYGRCINLDPAGVDTYGRIGGPSIRASRHVDRCIHDCRRRWSTHGTRHCLPHCHRCHINLGVGHYKAHVESHARPRERYAGVV